MADVLKEIGKVFGKTTMLTPVCSFQGGDGVVRHQFAAKFSPELAQAVLDRNIANRRVNRKNVNKYAATMERKEWAHSESMIMFDEGMSLINGQNRMLAILKAKREQVFSVCVGGPRKNIGVIDNGSARTVSNTYEVLYGMNPRAKMMGLMASLELMLRDRKSLTSSAAGHYGNEHIVGAIKGDEASLVASIDFIDGKLNALKSAGSKEAQAIENSLRPWHGVLAYCHYKFSKKNKADAQRIMERILSSKPGTKLKKSHPAMALRMLMLGNSKSHSKLKRDTVIHAFFVGWNTMRAGNEVIDPSVLFPVKKNYYPELS